MVAPIPACAAPNEADPQTACDVVIAKGNRGFRRFAEALKEVVSVAPIWIPSSSRPEGFVVFGPAELEQWLDIPTRAARRDFIAQLFGRPDVDYDSVLSLFKSAYIAHRQAKAEETGPGSLTLSGLSVIDPEPLYEPMPRGPGRKVKSFLLMREMAQVQSVEVPPSAQALAKSRNDAFAARTTALEKVEFCLSEGAGDLGADEITRIVESAMPKGGDVNFKRAAIEREIALLNKEPDQLRRKGMPFDPRLSRALTAVRDELQERYHRLSSEGAPQIAAWTTRMINFIADFRLNNLWRKNGEASPPLAVATAKSAPP